MDIEKLLQQALGLFLIILFFALPGWLNPPF